MAVVGLTVKPTTVYSLGGARRRANAAGESARTRALLARSCARSASRRIAICLFLGRARSLRHLAGYSLNHAQILRRDLGARGLFGARSAGADPPLSGGRAGALRSSASMLKERYETGSSAITDVVVDASRSAPCRNSSSPTHPPGWMWFATWVARVRPASLGLHPTDPPGWVLGASGLFAARSADATPPAFGGVGLGVVV